MLPMTYRPEISNESHDALLGRLERAERDLAGLRDQLEHSHRLAMIGTLSAGVIHEINNILTPVLAYAQMAGSNPHDVDLLAKAAEKAARGISQATAIAESMLELAQPGRPDTEPADALVGDACRSALSCLGRDPAKDGITVTIDVPEDLACAIRPLAMQQVILNLIINAIEALKSIPAKDRQLTIRARRRGSGPQIDGGDHAQPQSVFRETVRIEVADTGPGIPEGIRPNLFKPFVSGRQPNSSAESKISGGASGSGLGLSVCRTLIESAGGTVSAHDAPTSGTVFTIELPANHAHSHKMAG